MCIISCVSFEAAFLFIGLPGLRVCFITYLTETSPQHKQLSAPPHRLLSERASFQS
ncbi:hypothetical protein HanPI659440_Chr03g0101161 [Helianthus annuus]|nr:hypothetical protein HanHA300_Chr03g0079591 [Helianthus annuus]KAJ0767019.1 hypothetical protein HanLR1_Chr03g0084251 [Helianthus annuus]KAJ0800279.1 hypothetical protein HanPI659440_Chr03g0101161 [Helianthus annuus]